MVPEFIGHLDPTIKIVFFANIGLICWYIVLLLVTKNQHRSEPYLIFCIFMCSLAVMFSTMFSILFFIAISVPLFFFSKRRRYERTSYYKITQRPYYLTKEDAYLTEEYDDARAKAKGCYGEYLTYKCLRPFEKRGNKLLFDLRIPKDGNYIPKDDNNTTQIDVVMLSPKGIFVFEAKNYSGWIFGRERDQNWTQTLLKRTRQSHKERFYNPIKQNASHVKYLEKILKLKMPIWSVPILSIVVFSDKCVLKDITVNSKVKVVNMYQLTSTTEDICKKADDCISEIEIEDIFNYLLPYTCKHQK